MKRPGRPLGVSLAIMLSVLVFSVLPLLQVGLVLMVRQHFANLTFPDSGPQPVMIGGDFMGVSEFSLAMQFVLAAGFLVVAVCAWRGKPARTRLIMIGFVVGLTMLQFIILISQLLTQNSVPAGFSSGDSVGITLLMGQFAGSALIALYVAWYLNRGPARAFFRGYFLPESEPSLSPESDQA